MNIWDQISLLCTINLPFKYCMLFLLLLKKTVVATTAWDP